MDQAGEASAIITGAATGIGKATAVRLAEAGYQVHLIDIDERGNEQTSAWIEEQGGSASSHTADLSDRGALDTVFTRILEHTTPRLLVNNAGVGAAESIIETDFESWDRMVDLNLTATYRGCYLTLPRMISAGGGVVVNIASIAGQIGMHRRAAYCATKGGVIALTRAIAVDHGHQGIRANAICPGTVASEWIDKMIANDPSPEERRQQMAERQLDNRMGTPEEIAEGVAFLAGDTGRFINGAAMVMDGGMSIQAPA